ncbi:MAG: S8 family serine peptidase, partial [Parvularculales bacterium]
TCTFGCTSNNGPDLDMGITAPASTTTTTLTCKMEPPQTCSCTYGCTTQDGEYVANGAMIMRSTTATTSLTCRPPGPGVTCCSFTSHLTATDTAAEWIINRHHEFRNQAGLRTINNEYAVALDAMGEGVTIGIPNRGFDHLHSDLGTAKFKDNSVLAYEVEESDVPAEARALPVGMSPTIHEAAAGALHKNIIDGTNLKYACPAEGFGLPRPNPGLEALLRDNCQSDKTYIRQPDPDNAGAYLYWEIPEILSSGAFSTRHGTPLAAIMAASAEDSFEEIGMMGVAPKSRLLALTIKPSLSDVPDYIDFMVPTSQVLMFGFSGNSMIHLRSETEVRAHSTYSRVINSAMTGTLAAGELHASEKPLYVWGAGNYHQTALATYTDGATTPFELAGLPYHIDELRGRWLAVTAVTTGGDDRFVTPPTVTPANARIASFANRCGALPADWISDRNHPDYAGRHYCIAAPGQNIRSVIAGAHYAFPRSYFSGYSGTSNAAAHVAGALAVLIEHFPTLSLREVVMRMLDSANNTGTEFSKVAVYGAGLLDMEAALRPMGQIRATMGSSLIGVSLPLAGSHLIAGDAYGDALSLAFEGRTMAGFDDYHAPFPQLLSDLLTTPRPLSLAGRRDRLAVFDLETAHLTDGSVRMMGEHGMAAVLPLTGGGNNVSGNRGGSHLFMSHQASHGLPLGLRAIRTDGSGTPVMTADPSAFSNPFLGLAEQGVTVGMGQPFGDGVLRMAAFTGTGLMTTEDGLPNHSTRGEAHGVVVDYAISPTDDTSLSLAMGALMEDGQILGLASEGAFGTPPPVPALFSGLTLASRLSGGWSFLAQAHGGIARPEAPSIGLVKSTSPVIASAFSAGLTGSSIMTPDDQLSLIVSQPLRIEAGEMGITWGSGRTIGGQLLQGHADVTLTPSGREITFGIGYRAPLSDNITTEIRAGATRHSGHDATASTRLFGIASVDYDF